MRLIKCIESRSGYSFFESTDNESKDDYIAFATSGDYKAGKEYLLIISEIPEPKDYYKEAKNG